MIIIVIIVPIIQQEYSFSFQTRFILLRVAVGGLESVPWTDRPSITGSTQRQTRQITVHTHTDDIHHASTEPFIIENIYE